MLRRYLALSESFNFSGSSPQTSLKYRKIDVFPLFHPVEYDIYLRKECQIVRVYGPLVTPKNCLEEAMAGLIAKSSYRLIYTSGH